MLIIRKNWAITLTIDWNKRRILKEKGGSLIVAQYKKEDIRKKILENAKAEFLELGYKNASVASIARKSQIGVGNVYRYFKNKEAILDAIVTPVVERIKKTLIADTDHNDVNNHENILNIISEIMKEINDLSIN